MNMKNSINFVHSEMNQNLSSPRIILPILFKYIKPTSVVDIGCGTGRFLRAFKEFGIDTILGVDANWVYRELFEENIAENKFHVTDLGKISYKKLDRKFDLAVCIEVHGDIDQKYSDLIVENLTSLNDYILFCSNSLPGRTAPCE